METPLFDFSGHERGVRSERKNASLQAEMSGHIDLCGVDPLGGYR